MGKFKDKILIALKSERNEEVKVAWKAENPVELGWDLTKA